jgi:perosamine synthetase
MRRKINLTTDLLNLVLEQSESIRVAAKHLALNRKGILFIIDKDKKFTGTLSEGDIRRAFVSGVSPDSQISEIMFRHPVFYYLNTDINKIIDSLGLNGKLGEKLYIPIIDEKNGKIAGYYSYYDIKFIPIAKPGLKNTEMEYVVNCIEENWISSQGKYIGMFEESFASFLGSKYALAVSNGTVALHLSLVTMGIGPGDEVIVPGLTFIATANAVTYTGAKVVFADSEMDTWNIDPASIEKLITPRTKAIIPVHLYGQPCKMDEIMAISKKHNITVIEDAAEAHGAQYKGRYVGSIGQVGCFSFFGNKIITTGEGGMVVTDDREFYEKAKILRDHGMDPQRKYWHIYVGFNYRMTNMQAAIGFAQVERISEILRRKLQIAELFRKNLDSNPNFIFSPNNDWSVNICWMCSIVLRNGAYNGLSRDALIEVLKKQNIESRPFFYPIYKMPPYASDLNLPVCEYLSANGINLPSFPELKDDEIEHICKFINGCAPIHHD